MALRAQRVLRSTSSTLRHRIPDESAVRRGARGTERPEEADAVDTGALNLLFV